MRTYQFRKCFIRRTRLSTPAKLQRGHPSLTYIVAVPGRNLNGEITVNHGLTAQTGAQGKACSHIQAVKFIVFRLREVLLSFQHDDVAGGAGAASAASVIQVKPFVQSEI